jgi:protein-disulfide isomerase
MEDAGAFQQQIANLPPGQAFTRWAEKLGFIEFAKQRGLPEAQVRACLTDKKAIDDLVKYMDEGTKAGIHQTPTFILNGQTLDAASWPQVEQALKNAGA